MALEGLIADICARGLPTAGWARQLYYWRTKSGSEVDFIVYGPEVFSGHRKSSARAMCTAPICVLYVPFAKITRKLHRACCTWARNGWPLTAFLTVFLKFFWSCIQIAAVF